MNYCNGPHCWVACSVMALGWLLVTSGLITLAWNKVIVEMSRFKAVKHWQVLLVLLALVALCLPIFAAKKRCWGGHRGGECPYEASEAVDKK